jgi:hypothetical protein
MTNDLKPNNEGESNGMGWGRTLFLGNIGRGSRYSQARITPWRSPGYSQARITPGQEGTVTDEELRAMVPRHRCRRRPNRPHRFRGGFLMVSELRNPEMGTFPKIGRGAEGLFSVGGPVFLLAGLILGHPPLVTSDRLSR